MDDPSSDLGVAAIPLIWGVDEVLYPTDPATGGTYGCAVANEGSWALVGSASNPAYPLPGKVYALEWTASGWAERQQIEAPTPVGGDGFGGRVDIDGETAIVGSCFRAMAADAIVPGMAHILRRSTQGWAVHQPLDPDEPVDLTGDYGCAVALDGDLAVVGDPHDDELGMDRGAVHVFVREEPFWHHHAKLLCADPAAEYKFGWSLELQSGRLVVGATPMGAPSTAGAAYVYEWDGNAFTGEIKLCRAMAT